MERHSETCAAQCSSSVYDADGDKFERIGLRSFAIETIFSWNGIGKFAVESVKAKDLPVVEGYIVTVALTYIPQEIRMSLRKIVYVQYSSYSSTSGISDAKPTMAIMVTIRE